MFIVTAAGIKDSVLSTEVLALGNNRTEVARRAAEAIVARVIKPHNKVINGARAMIRMNLARCTQNGNNDAFELATTTCEAFMLFGQDTRIEMHNLGRLITVTDTRKVVR